MTLDPDIYHCKHGLLMQTLIQDFGLIESLASRCVLAFTCHTSHPTTFPARVHISSRMCRHHHVLWYDKGPTKLVQTEASLTALFLLNDRHYLVEIVLP